MSRARRETPAAHDFNSGPPEIRPEEITNSYVLGDGSFGTVYKGRCRQKDVAVKVLHKQELDQKTLEAFRREVEIVSKTFHPNIVLFMGACTQPGHLMIVSEFMPKGNLEEMLQNPQVQLSLVLRMRMARDAALGMNWLHNSNPQFIHRDLKTSNLLVDENNRIKICDFGLSQIKTQGENLMDGAEGAKGTPLWMAPEVLSGKPFNEKADVYSFGIVLWEILTRKEPFEEFETFEEFRTAVCFHHVRPPIPANTLPRLAALIEACWTADPARRPSFDQIIAQLDHVIVECAIQDEIGRRLWKRNFLKKDAVPWSDFLEHFMELIKQLGYPAEDILPSQVTHEQFRAASTWQLQEFGTRSIVNANLVSEELARRAREGSDRMDQENDDNTNIRCLHAVLSNNNNDGAPSDEEDLVGMEKFGQILHWFGPIVDPATNKVVLLDSLRELLSKDWFHGDISTSQAEKLLNRRPEGTFLVRFSSVVGHYTISKACSDRITHQRVMHQPNQGFFYKSQRYPTLVALISAAMIELGLTHACPGSRFQRELFHDPLRSAYVQSSYHYLPSGDHE